MSEQGHRVLTNPCVNSGSCFGDDFWVRRDLVFLDNFWVNWGCVRWWIQAAGLQAVSVMISQLAATQFSFNIYELTGAVCADESKRQLSKQFRWWFLSRRGLSFSWIFLSEEGLCALSNPSISSASSFDDYFCGSSDVVLLDYFWVNSCCARWRIHSLALEAVSLMISELASTEISSTISESTRAACADESVRHLWSLFR